MIRNASEMRTAARQALSGKWGDAVVLTLIYMIVMGAAPTAFNVLFPSGAGGILSLLLLPLGYSYTIAFLDNLRTGESCRVEQLLSGFKDYLPVLGTMLLTVLYIVLWSLLLIIPGIIKNYSYAQTFYVLRDNPEMKFNAAIERSMAMMKGHKFDLFYLDLTFIGWGLLCCLTLGIGYLWLCPYMTSAKAQFYEDVKAEFELRTSESAQANS